MPLKELPIPPECNKAKRANEFLRGWIVDGKLQVTLVSALGQPGDRKELSASQTHASAWGNLLYEIATHVANSLEPDNDDEYDKVLRRIWASFQASLIHPSHTPDGENVE